LLEAVGRQAHAVQEEDDEDADIAHLIQVQRATCFAQIGQQRGQQHGGDHADEEAVDGPALRAGWAVHHG